MKIRLALVLCMMLAANQVFAAEKLELKTPKDKLSYAIGVNIASKLRTDSIEVDPDIITRGIKDTMSGNKTLMTEKESKDLILAVQQEGLAKYKAEKKKESEDFLAKNKLKEGVKTLPSGLQYKVITQGKGKSPKAKDTVVVHYRGTLVNGTEFNSTRKEPATFPVSGVMRGWTEALRLMKEGSKWQIYIPSDLAYGEEGRPGIPPNSALVFDVELLKVKK